MRDYVSADTPSPRQQPPAERPRPGSGTVWLNEVPELGWRASWQDDGHRVLDSPFGTREAAIAWALTADAPARRIFVAELDSYMPLRQWLEENPADRQG